jgi:hypothetical protein
MTQQILISDAIETTVSGFMKTRHSLQSAEEELGEFLFPAAAFATVGKNNRRRMLNPKATFICADGRELQMERKEGTYELRQGERPLATAHKSAKGHELLRLFPLFTTLFRLQQHTYLQGYLIVNFDEEVYTVKKTIEGLLVVYYLLDDTESQLMKIKGRSFFSRGYRITLESPVALELLVFVYFLVYVWRIER